MVGPCCKHIAADIEDLNRVFGVKLFCPSDLTSNFGCDYTQMQTHKSSFINVMCCCHALSMMMLQTTQSCVKVVANSSTHDYWCEFCANIKSGSIFQARPCVWHGINKESYIQLILPHTILPILLLWGWNVDSKLCLPVIMLAQNNYIWIHQSNHTTASALTSCSRHMEGVLTKTDDRGWRISLGVEAIVQQSEHITYIGTSQYMRLQTFLCTLQWLLWQSGQQ